MTPEQRRALQLAATHPQGRLRWKPQEGWTTPGGRGPAVSSGVIIACVRRGWMRTAHFQNQRILIEVQITPAGQEAAR